MLVLKININVNITMFLDAIIMFSELKMFIENVSLQEGKINKIRDSNRIRRV